MTAVYLFSTFKLWQQNSLTAWPSHPCTFRKHVFWFLYQRDDELADDAARRLVSLCSLTLQRPAPTLCPTARTPHESRNCRPQGHRLRIEPRTWKACARALAEAGCEVVINGRDAKKLEAAAAELSGTDRRQGYPRRRRRRDRRGPEGAARRLPTARHPGQQQCRPADARFPRADPPADDRRRHRQHGGGDRAHPESDRPDVPAQFGRIVNITSGSVKMPLAGPRSVVGRARRT